MRNNTLTPAEKAAGWVSLFDGRTLDGWAATGSDEGWTVEDNAIMCTVRGGGYLYTLNQYENFLLSIDFRIEEGVNSGIFVRWSDLQDPVNTGIEVQVLDSYGRGNPGKHDCGAIYDLVAPAKQACRPAGEWNHVLITCDQDIISVELNNEPVVEMDVALWNKPGRNPDGTKNKYKYAWSELPRQGHIGLQDHGGRVWYRNIAVKEL